MKVALDPYMFRRTPLLELPGVVADLGYEYIELSPRDDFTPFFLHPRIDDGGVRQFKKALDAAGVKVAAHLPLYRWSGPDEDERQAAVRYWKRAIQITVDLDCHVMNSEFNGRPEQASLSEGKFWRSHGGAAAGLRARGHGAAAGAAPRRLRRGRPGGRRHGPRHQQPAGVVPVLRAAHLPHGRRHGRDHGVRRRPADPPARGRRLRPHARPRGCATSSTRRARPPGCTSTWTSGRARWTGTCSSPRCRSSASGTTTATS